MEIKYYGGNCIRVSYKKVSVITDDITKLGQKSVVTDKDIQLISDSRYAEANPKAHFVINGPGEYEVSEVSISGIAARSHMDNEGTELSTMYRVIIDGVRVAVIGHIYPELSEEQLESLGTIDLLIIPVGGNGYTLDPVGAQKLIQNIEPKIVIPTHYDDKSLSYEVPQRTLEDALKELGMDPAETTENYKLKNTDFGDTAKLVVVTKK